MHHQDAPGLRSFNVSAREIIGVMEFMISCVSTRISFWPSFHFFVLQCAVDVFQANQPAGSSLQLDVCDRQGEIESGVPFLQVRYLLVS